MTIAPSSPHGALLAATLGLDFDPSTVDWPVVAELAVRERMALRLEEWFRNRGLALPESLDRACVDARARTRAAAAIIAHLSPSLERRGVPHVFLGIAQSRPDIGRDLDLLVAPGSDLALPAETPEVPLDIQRGLGRAGEHYRFTELVLQRREILFAYPGPAMVPSPEDRLLLLAVKRIYGRPSIRLGDVSYAWRALHSGPLDIERLIENAAESGLRDGLSCFLEYADQVVRGLLGTPLLGAALRSRLPGGPWGHVALNDGTYRGSIARVAPYLYVRLVATRIFAGDLGSAGRVAMLPLTLAVRRRRRRDAGTSSEIADA